jgi:hypothetical protein
MRRYGLFIWLGLGFATAALAAEPAAFDAKARARAVGRFVADDAFLVAHLDVRRLNVEPLFDQIQRLGIADQEQVDLTRTTVAESVEQFLKAGGEEAFVVLSPSLSPLLIVPVPAAADEATIFAILGQAPLETTEKIGGAIVAGTEQAVSDLRAAPPRARPEMVRAFEVLEDRAVQVLLIPTAAHRRTVEELLPVLLPELGGAATGPALGNLNWLALAVDGPPEASLRIVADTAGPQAAYQLKSLAETVLDALEQRPDVQNWIPDPDRARKVFGPTVAGTRVRLEITGRQFGEMLRQPLERAHKAGKSAK